MTEQFNATASGCGPSVGGISKGRLQGGIAAGCRPARKRAAAGTRATEGRDVRRVEIMKILAPIGRILALGWSKRVYLLMLAVLGWGVSGTVQSHLNRQRAELGLTSNAPLTNAPPVLAFTTVALGAFRGLIANALWMRAAEQQERGRFFEAVQLAEWIAKLQPRSPRVWQYLAWNLAYNVAGCFTEPADRWRWVQRGIELIRDRGLVWNPRAPELYTELATYYQHKLGLDLDPAHRFYKAAWAAEMVRVLGRSPDWEALRHPRTEAEQARARQLRETYRLDPEFMHHVEEHYGPLDWRLPEAHALYWADLGLKLYRPHDPLPLRRVIWQSMLGAFKHGRLIENFADRELDFSPNLALAERVHETFEEACAADPTRAEYIGRAHRNFHREVVALMYAHNRLEAAAAWFQRLQAEYPDAVPAGMDLHEFVIAQVTRIAAGASPDRVRAVIEGLLVTAYERYALGEDDAAVGHVLLARQIWQRHQARFAGQEERAGLPPFETLQQAILERVLSGETLVSARLAETLRQRAGLEPAANAHP